MSKQKICMLVTPLLFEPWIMISNSGPFCVGVIADDAAEQLVPEGPARSALVLGGQAAPHELDEQAARSGGHRLARPQPERLIDGASERRGRGP